ncbi:MAG: hypothetical protein GY940_20285 [bacterium]|nr:hypothetical protein [bacterium]
MTLEKQHGRKSSKTGKPVKPKRARGRKYDSAWKEVIERLFESFLKFYFPALHEVIDFSKKVEFLNNELREITAGTDLGDREADVLVKVPLKNGRSRYIHIIFHFEVQGQGQDNFMERMFIYYYRAFDNKLDENIPVASAAIFTDNDPNYKPCEYEVEFCGFELYFKIPVVKILDYKLDPILCKKLETSDSPMAIVTRAQLKSLELKKSDEETKFEATKELIRECYRKGYSREYVRVLIKFIEWVFRSSKKFEKRLKEAITIIEEEYKMEYLASWEREAIKKGKKEGEDNKAIKIAKEMLKDGLPIPSIMKYTGLSQKKINQLAAKSH